MKTIVVRISTARYGKQIMEWLKLDGYSAKLYKPRKRVCEWTSDCYGYENTWDTACHNKHYFSNDADIRMNGYKYCPYCGGVIKQEKG